MSGPVSNGLVHFLIARIAEDEKIAYPATYEGCFIDEGEEWLLPFLDQFSGDRMLAECKAKRAIIADHPQDPYHTADCNRCEDRVFDSPLEWPCPTLRLLAVPYADHPDYREEWRP